MPDLPMLSMFGVDAFWGLVLGVFEADWATWGAGKVRFNCLLWCLHGLSPYAVTFKDCVMGALHARLSDLQYSHTLEDWGSYIRAVGAVGGNWTCTHDTVQAAPHLRYAH